MLRRISAWAALMLIGATAVASFGAQEHGLSGVVLDAEGKPAVGVAVLLVEPGDNPDLFNGRLGGLYGAELASTDDEGRFYFARSPGGAYRLIALGENGYGESEVAHAGDAVPPIAMQPWATIEGVARVGGTPVGGAVIRGNLDEPLAENWGIVPSADHWIQINADPDGTFKLDRLKPGLWRVSQAIPFSPGERPFPSHPEHVEVAAGGSASVTLGGGGRPVVGRVEMPQLDPPLTGRLACLQNDWPDPDAKLDVTYGEVQAMPQAKREALAATDAFREYARRMNSALERRQFYAITVQPDGTFRADDVPPGEYALIINLRQRGDGGAEVMVERSIVVPAPEGDADEPFDLGTLPIKSVVNLGVGDDVPDVTFKTVDGAEHKLSDFRGKYVLLDAWATWCGPCVGETPNILAVQEAFKGDDRLAIVGLSMDDDPDAPRRYSEMKGLTWTNGFIGQWDQTEVDDQIGIGGIPDIRLIGPDGKLIANNLRGERILEAVRNALAPNGP